MLTFFCGALSGGILTVKVFRAKGNLEEIS